MNLFLVSMIILSLIAANRGAIYSPEDLQLYKENLICFGIQAKYAEIYAPILLASGCSSPCLSKHIYYIWDYYCSQTGTVLPTLPKSSEMCTVTTNSAQCRYGIVSNPGECTYCIGSGEYEVSDQYVTLDTLNFDCQHSNPLSNPNFNVAF